MIFFLYSKVNRNSFLQAIDLRDQAQEHPVVQGVSNVVRPVGQWVKVRGLSALI